METTAHMTQTMPTGKKEKKILKKLLVICSKGTLEDVYAALVMTNGALMEGIEANMFFTFFGLDAISKKRQDQLHTASVGNPALHVPTFIGGLPGMETMISTMMKNEMEKLDIPPVSEFLEMIVAGGGKLYGCQLAFEMFKLKREDLIDDLEDIITVGEMFEMAEGERTQIIFV